MRLSVAHRSKVEDYTTSVSAFIRNWLQHREHILDSLLKNMEGMAYCCLMDAHWTMLFISDGCYELTGYRPDELLHNGRTSFEELTLAEDRARIRQIVDEAISRRERFEIEYRITTIDGQIRWVNERGTGIFNPQGEVEALEGFIQDITQRKLSEQALQEAERRYRNIFENSIEGIFQTSHDGQYINANPALARIYGYDNPEALIQSLNNIAQQLYVQPESRQAFLTLMQLEDRVVNFESQIYRRDGSVIWISENARAVRNEEGKLLYFEGTVEDITERKSYNALIEYQATHDDLTGLPNRTLMQDRLLQAISYADRTASKLAVVFVDLDKFKDINDSMGHFIGDQLLIAMARRLESCIRDSDTVARPGGDEFVLLLSNIHGMDALSQTLQRVLALTSEPCSIEGKDFTVTSSIGISLYPDDGKTSETLLKNADTAMYKAKQEGKNNFQFYTRELNSILVERLEMEYQMRNALGHNEFHLYYQPKLNLRTQRITGLEALIRWQNPRQGMISPNRFIPIAEESSLIEQIGSWVLEKACRESIALSRLSGYDVPVSVNVSPRQFQQSDLVGNIARVLQETGLPPALLELEITEGTLADTSPRFIKVLNDLKGLGVKLAIDDFGTGYSSLGYLKHFPIDNLKIDRSFVMGLESDTANQAILKAIVALGHNLGINLVAEGVETERQRDFLLSIGCDEMQGFLFSQPLPFEQTGKLLLAQDKLV
jgi:diguanylate cyclase (GGDEF)-like protein/PAS domain S-box-containing protein